MLRQPLKEGNMKKNLLSIVLSLVLAVLIIPTAVHADTTVETRLNEMTLREKIGQLIMPDFRYWTVEGGSESGVTVMNDEIEQIVKDYQFGGVILFAQNVTGTEQTTRLTHDYQQIMIEDNKTPLLLTIDQEGGNVVRLGTGTSLPGNMAIGATRDKDAAYTNGQIIGTELHALGINVAFAPVLDVNNNPNNPVIGERSISSDPQIVAELGVSMLKGIQDQKVVASAKHFPGHGDTATDSHLGLPLVDKSYEELEKVELLPFFEAAKAGVDMIMTAHISYPQIEKDVVISKKDGSSIHYPATLSDDILTGIVREKMNYDGVVVTDALNMQAIADHFGEVEAVVLTIEAGADIALMPTILRSKADTTKLDAIYQGIEDAIQSGRLSEDRIDTSVRRILELKHRRGLFELQNDTRTIEAKVSNALATVGSKAHRELEREITQKAITVGKNDNNMLPFNPKAGEKVVMLTPYANELPALTYGFTRLQREGVISNDVIYQTLRYTSATTETDLRNWTADADYIIVVSEIGNATAIKPTSWLSGKPQMVVDIANEYNIDHVVVSIGKPYDLARYANTKAHVLAYASKGMDPTEPGQEPTTTYGPNIPTSLDIVFGAVEAKGILPVDIMKLDSSYSYTNEVLFPIGHGYHNLKTQGSATYDLPSVIREGDVFQVKATLADTGALLDGDYSLDWDYDTTAFEVATQSARALASDPTVLTLRALKSGSDLSISVATITDAKDRTYTVTSEPTHINVLNVSAYTAVVDTYTKLDSGKYTENSFNTVKNAYTSLVQVNESTSLTQAQLDEAVLNLQNAISALKLKEASNPGDDTPGGQDGNLPSAGTESTHYMQIGIALTLLGATLIAFKRKNEKI